MKMNKALRTFFWSGAEETRKSHTISWAKICRPKEEGGLGVRCVEDWNRGGQLKLFWRFVNSKDSLWAGLIGSRVSISKEALFGMWIYRLTARGLGVAYSIRGKLPARR